MVGERTECEQRAAAGPLPHPIYNCTNTHTHTHTHDYSRFTIQFTQEYFRLRAVAAGLLRKIIKLHASCLTRLCCEL